MATSSCARQLMLNDECCCLHTCNQNMIQREYVNSRIDNKFDERFVCCPLNAMFKEIFNQHQQQRWSAIVFYNENCLSLDFS